MGYPDQSVIRWTTSSTVGGLFFSRLSENERCLELSELKVHETRAGAAMNPFADLEEWPRWVALWRRRNDKGRLVKEGRATIEARALKEAGRSDASWGPFGFNVAAVRTLHRAMWSKVRAQIASSKKVVHGFQPPTATIESIDPRIASLLKFDVLKRTAEGEGLVFRGVEIRSRDEVRIEGTGAPGRPTKSMHLILDEARRRLADGKLEDSQQEAAKSLLAWLHSKYPDAPPPGIKSIINKLADLRRKRPPAPATRG